MRLQLQKRVFLAIFFVSLWTFLRIFLALDGRLDLLAPPGEQEFSFFPNQSIEQPDEKSNISRLEEAEFYSLAKFNAYLETVDLEHLHKAVLHYENFSIPLPLFASAHDAALFNKSVMNFGELRPRIDPMLTGEVEVVRRATFRIDFDCGWRLAQAAALRKPVPYSPQQQYRKFHTLTPLVVPQGWSFQHFMDGTFPKLAQAYALLKRPSVNILLEEPSQTVVKDLLRRLGLLGNVVSHARSDRLTVYGAEYAVMACRAPPLHPELWTAMRQRLGVPDEPVPEPDRLVILLTRKAAANPGRTILNFDPFVALLRQRYGAEHLLIHEPFPLQRAMQLYRRASVIIGVHGAAFYNMHFAPRSAKIVEIVPVMADGSDVPNLPARTIFWVLASVLRMRYFYVPVVQATSSNDVTLDLNRMKRVLDKVDVT